MPDDPSQTRAHAAPWLSHIRDVWGEVEAEALMDCCDLLLQRYPDQLWIWHHTQVAQHERTLILTGERTWLPGQLPALARIAAPAMARYGFRPGVRPLPSPALVPHIYFSGGVIDRLHTGEFTADMLNRMFFDKRENDWLRPYTSVDSLARNTGDQGLFFARLVRLHKFTNIVLLYSYEHLARIAAVLLHGLKLEIGHRVKDISIIPACYGDAHTVPADRAAKVSLAREAFGSHLPMTPDEESISDFLKLRCGQHTTRWHESMSRRDDPTWTCGAYPPSDLLTHLKNQPVQFDAAARGRLQR